MKRPKVNEESRQKAYLGLQQALLARGAAFPAGPVYALRFNLLLRDYIKSREEFSIKRFIDWALIKWGNL